jgi:hypothetical protein
MEIAGQVEMDRGIARFADAVADYRPIWPVIEDDFYALEKDQFKSEGAETGEKWAQLADSTLRQKEALYPGKPILERAGALVASLTDPGADGAVHIEARKQLTLGTTVAYALYHQTGTLKMPARQEIRMPEPFKRQVMHHVQTYLVQVASQSGLRSGMGPLDAARLAAHGARKPDTGI